VTAPRLPRLALRDILDAIGEIEQFDAGLPPSLAGIDRKTYAAVLYSLLKISEASRQLPDADRATRPDLPWRDMARLGNALRHHYFRLKLEIVADIVANDLPALKSAARAMLRDADGGER
jgi:uncharacterized protein with HEPN domain